MSATQQLRRLLAILPHLADGEERTYEEIAACVGADWETIRDDLYALSERDDAPGGFVEEVQLYFGERGVRAFSSQFHRPMRLTAGEAAALELGLAMLRAERSPEEHAAIDSARQRIRDVRTRVGDTPPLALRHAEAAAGDSMYLARVSEAMRLGRKVRIAYRSSGHPDLRSRTICPFGVVASRAQWYVVAHCETSEAVRVFRLDRIEGVDVTPETFVRPEGFTIDSVVRDDTVFHGDAPASMTVRYSPRIAAWIAEHETGELQEDGSFMVEHPVADVRWAVRHVLQYGPEAEVLEPPELREAVVERLRGILGRLEARETGR